MGLTELAKEEPDAPVRLIFAGAHLNTTAAHADCPNKSMRFFPPEGETAASLGWAKPWYYHTEILRWMRL